MSVLESQAQGLLFSRVQAYLGELDFLRVRFNDFLSGPAPQIAGSRLRPVYPRSRDRISPSSTRGQYRASGCRLSGCGLAGVEGQRGGTRPARARVGRISTDR